jgi:hypothetical protein
MRWISVVRSLYFITFSASFLVMFLLPEIATSINILFLMISGLLLLLFYNIRTSLPWKWYSLNSSLCNCLHSSGATNLLDLHIPPPPHTFLCFTDKNI